MGRLFWTFPDGLPGTGLLLMRLALGGALLAGSVSAWPGGPFVLAALCVAEALGAVLLFAGLATPIWGAGAALVELWRAATDTNALVVHLLMATLGAALALLGPGAFSVDASLFGWRRVDVPDAPDAISPRPEVRTHTSNGPHRDSN